MADHMHGMFAFALWDESEEKLFCLRDQFGTKPFYYYETADGKLHCVLIVAAATVFLITGRSPHPDARS